VFLPPRIEVLDCNKLKVEHFKDQEQAFKAADLIVAAQREKLPGIAAQHPDQVFPAMPILDLFYFASHKGTWG